MGIRRIKVNTYLLEANNSTYLLKASISLKANTISLKASISPEYNTSNINTNTNPECNSIIKININTKCNSSIKTRINTGCSNSNSIANTSTGCSLNINLSTHKISSNNREIL